MVNNSSEGKVRKRSDVSKTEKIKDEIINENNSSNNNDLFKKYFYSNLNAAENNQNNLNFNKLTFMQENNYIVDNNHNNNHDDVINGNTSKIKISLPTDLVDDYFNFTHSEQLSNKDEKENLQKNCNIEDNLGRANNDDDQTKSLVKTIANQIFLIKKMKKKIKSSKNIQPNILKKKKSKSFLKKSISNISRISSTSYINHEMNSNSILKYKLPSEGILRKETDRSNFSANASDKNFDLLGNIISETNKQQINSNLNNTTPKNVFPNTNTIGNINNNTTNSNTNIFFDPNKNHFINIVNINYGCNDNKIEEKANPILLKNIYNNIPANSCKYVFNQNLACAPVNNVINYNKEFNDLNGMFNMNIKNVENKPVGEDPISSIQHQNCFNGLNDSANMNMNLSNLNNITNVNNNLLNMIAAQRIFNTLNQQNYTHNLNKDKTQGKIN